MDHLKNKAKLIFIGLCVTLAVTVIFLSFKEDSSPFSDARSSENENALLEDEMNAEAPPRLGRVTELPLPRFIATRAKEVNFRKGVGKTYEIIYTFNKPGIPLEVIDEYEEHFKVKDPAGQEGWVVAAFTTKNRYALVTAKKAFLRASVDERSASISEAAKDVILRISSCEENACEVKAGTVKGWIRKKDIFGVYPHEKGAPQRDGNLQ